MANSIFVPSTVVTVTNSDGLYTYTLSGTGEGQNFVGSALFSGDNIYASSQASSGQPS
jgi:hypothetical protein